MDDDNDSAGGSRVKSVEVAVQILDSLTDAATPVRVSDLARRLNMTKARVSRHLQTLMQLGLVDRAREGEGYIFGRKLLKFGRAAVYRSSIVQLAEPFLRDLFAATGHTTLLAIPSRGGAIVISSVNNQFEPGIMLHPGMVLTLPTSPAARLIHFFEGQMPPLPIVEHNLRVYGLDFEANPHGTGLGGIAAPIFEPDGSIAGTIGLILSTSLMMPHPSSKLLEQVRETASKLQNEYAEGSVSSAMLELLGRVED